MTKMKVLAVDDNRTNLHILQVFLKKLGHVVVLAENGEEAVRKFEAELPDLVLLDIMMPVMDGFEAARRIKAMTRDRWTPVIFLSALNRDENLVEGLDAGADDYLTKPINFVVLEAKLRSMQRSLSMQQASIDSLRRVQAISDNVLDAIVTTDETGAIVSINQSTERIFGWLQQELIGQNLAMLMPEETMLGSPGRLPLASEGGSSPIVARECEILAQHRDGHRFPATITTSQFTLDNHRMLISVIRDITERKQTERKLAENAHQLQDYYDQTQAEQQLALRLMEKQLHRSGLNDRCLRYKVIPATHFSGDIVAAARSADGLFYALLADATGHGLAAAISVLPVLALFYRMTKLSRSVQDIVLELNQQLQESMPVGRFVAVTLVCLDESSRRGEIWVGGTPEAFLLDGTGQVAQTFPSANLPLGIVTSSELGGAPMAFTWEPKSQLVLCSDGLLEATNAADEQFGMQGLIRAAANTSSADRFEKIEQALQAYQDGNPASDDISLMLIDCP
ncbi:SpoIIE family protein phosphatase [Dechloromonas sp. XY25]|uniref:SpoIIE family protein phosphatase n=1 Tax=Dechloromonas hankyongensis TaxID=2908002 RepID=A0ABS9JZ36_9RHOO|nr:SpoIIE family protein phosphatase [Dechloromonas hankyongensis]MCG2576177.1 SpoIIE family protein phosphatase [Dechloromonas hankyongensis]